MKRWEELFTDWNRAMEQGIGVGRLLADIAVEHAKLEAVASAAREMLVACGSVESGFVPVDLEGAEESLREALKEL